MQRGKGDKGGGRGRGERRGRGEGGVMTRMDDEESVTFLNIRLLVTTAYKLSQRVSSRKRKEEKKNERKKN